MKTIDLILISLMMTPFLAHGGESEDKDKWDVNNPPGTKQMVDINTCLLYTSPSPRDV